VSSYVTASLSSASTQAHFFGFASLRDLPDLERLKAEGLMQTGQGRDDLDSALGLAEEVPDSLEDNYTLWG
jgi:hypothetical protein